MKKLKVLLVCICCTIILFGCGKKADESKRVQGTKDEIAQSLINDMIAGDYEDVYDKYAFSKELDDIAKSGRFESILTPYFNMLGNISGIEEPFHNEVAGTYIVHFPSHCELGDINIVITFDSEDKISNVRFTTYHTSLEEGED